jgi:alpha-tubulin suppressor-like RCC1 family protein
VRGTGLLTDGGALRIATATVTLLALLGIAACAGTSGHSSPSGKAASGTVVYTFGVAGTRGPVPQTLHEKPTPIPGIAGTVVQIATSNSDTYALTSTGTVWAWGVGSYGELGNGATPAYVRTAAKVTFPAGVKITSLPNPMPFDGGLAIDSTGDAWAWGLNVSHDLCLPSGLLVARPVRIPLSHVTLATGARTHSLFDSDGTVYACGDGVYGELGDGSTASRPTPTAVVRLPPGKVRALTSSWGGSGALMADGSYYDWGYNQAGQLGDGATTDSAVPVHVSLPGRVDEVFQGGSGPANGQTIAVLADGSLWTWGNGTHGQLGDGSTRSSTTPIRITLPGGATPVTVASGGFACYAIDQTGRLWAWGRNQDGQLGTGSSGPDQLTPVATGISLTQISSTAQNAAGLRT